MRDLALALQHKGPVVTFQPRSEPTPPGRGPPFLLGAPHLGGQRAEGAHRFPPEIVGLSPYSFGLMDVNIFHPLLGCLSRAQGVDQHLILC